MSEKKLTVDVECYSPFICLSCPVFDLHSATLFAGDEPYERHFQCSHLPFCQKLLPKVEAFYEAKFASSERNGVWQQSEIPCEEYVFSECGAPAWYYDVSKCVARSQFCPSCGARMNRGDGDA